MREFLHLQKSSANKGADLKLNKNDPNAGKSFFVNGGVTAAVAAAAEARKRNPNDKVKVVHSKSGRKLMGLEDHSPSFVDRLEDKLLQHEAKNNLVRCVYTT